jgi:hypothetical protein
MPVIDFADAVIDLLTSIQREVRPDLRNGGA